MREVIEVLSPLITEIMKWLGIIVITTTIIHELFETIRAWINK